MRQLNLDGRIKYDPVRELRRLRKWSDELVFPAGPYEGCGYFHWKIPVPRKLVSGPSARRPIQATCAQILIDGAKRLADIRPFGLGHVRVAAILGLPDMFSSEICVFVDPNYFVSFCDRDAEEQRWTAASDSHGLDQLGLTIPAGFTVRGFNTIDRDDTFDPPYVEIGETWLIGEVDL